MHIHVRKALMQELSMRLWNKLPYAKIGKCVLSTWEHKINKLPFYLTEIQSKLWIWENSALSEESLFFFFALLTFAADARTFLSSRPMRKKAKNLKWTHPSGAAPQVGRAFNITVNSHLNSLPGRVKRWEGLFPSGGKVHITAIWESEVTLVTSECLRWNAFFFTSPGCPRQKA